MMWDKRGRLGARELFGSRLVLASGTAQGWPGGLATLYASLVCLSEFDS